MDVLQTVIFINIRQNMKRNFNSSNFPSLIFYKLQKGID